MKVVVEKTLDTIADGGKILFKEYGKQKISIAHQDQFKMNFSIIEMITC